MIECPYCEKDIHYCHECDEYYTEDSINICTKCGGKVCDYCLEENKTLKCSCGKLFKKEEEEI